MIVPLLKAAQDRRLLGASINWRAQQLELMATLEGSEVTIAWNCSRQSGKSSMAAAAAVWNATMRDDLDGMVPRGRIRYVLVASPSEAQSREFIRICQALVDASPVLRSLAGPKADRIDFALPSGAKTAILAMPARDSSARGKSASLIVLDEAGHLADTEGPASDERLFASLTPSTVVFGDSARILLASTPHGEGNLFHRIVTEAEAGALPSARAIWRTIREMNPDVTEEWLEARRAELGEALFAQEYEAAFLAGVSNFIDLSRISFAAGPALPSEGRNWIAAADVGYHNDLTGVAIIGESVDMPGQLLLGACTGIKGDGALSYLGRRKHEDAVLAEVWRAIEPYRPRRLAIDQYQAGPVRLHFEELGLAVSVVNITGELKRKMFTSLRARLEGGSLLAWGYGQLLADLRRVRVTAGDTIELGRAGNSHCDVAMATAIGAWQFRGFAVRSSDRPRAGYSGLLTDETSAEEWMEARSRAGGRPEPDPSARGARSVSQRPPSSWDRGSSIRDMDF